MNTPTQPAEGLPELPPVSHGMPYTAIDYYTADQMRAYARKAIAAATQPEHGSRRPIAWIVQTEHHGECYQFSDEFVERFPGAPADLTPFTPAALDVERIARDRDELQRVLNTAFEHLDVGRGAQARRILFRYYDARAALGGDGE